MKNVLILGATSAVAGEVARCYADEGCRFFLVGRNKEKLAALTKVLGNQVVDAWCSDLDETQQAKVIVDAAFDSLGSIDLVLVAHGALGSQLLSEQDFEHAHQIIHTNYVSAVALLIPVVRRMRRQRSGKIAVLVSVAGDRGRPRNFTYGSAKGALHTYLQGLRSVLYKSGVEVYSFKLGPVDSPMTVDHEKNFSFSSKQKVARIIVKTLAGKRYNRYVPGFWFWVMLMVRWLPEPVFQRLKFLSER